MYLLFVHERERERERKRERERERERERGRAVADYKGLVLNNYSTNLKNNEAKLKKIER